MSGHQRRWLVGVAAVGAVLGQVGVASAHGDSERERNKSGSTTSAADTASGGPNISPDEGTRRDREEGHGEEAEEREDEHPIKFALDLVIGFGKTAIASQDFGPLGVNTANSISQSQVNTESFIVAAGLELGKHFELGARLPLTIGSFNPATEQSRGTSALGNLELEAQLEKEFNERSFGTFSLGFTLPTAQGDEVPADPKDLNQDATGRIDQTNYDRFSLNRAAASSRGWEDNALFEPKRFGIIPRIGVGTHLRGGLNLEAYVKLENLIDTSGHADHSYIGELVPGARISFRASPHFEPGVRVWGNIVLTGTDDKAVAVAEPELRFPFHQITPMLGVILPFAGPLTDPYFIGIRAAVAAQF